MIDDDPLDGMKVHCEVHRRDPGEHPGYHPQLGSCGVYQRVPKHFDPLRKWRKCLRIKRNVRVLDALLPEDPPGDSWLG